MRLARHACLIAFGVLMAFPFLILVIAIMSILGPGLTNLYIAVGVVGWIPYARITRGETLATRLVSMAMKLAVRRMIERRVDGIAVMTFGMEEVLTNDAHLRSTPLVFVDQSPDDERSSHIHIDYLHGIGKAIEHLAQLGHSRIAFISGPLVLPSALERRNAYLNAMRQQGIATYKQWVIEGDHTMEGGMRALQRICTGLPLQEELRPTAVVCSNDMTAIGVLRQAYEMGLSVPKDLSVIGFDDIRLARFIIPPLTTVRMSQSRLAELAFQELLAATDKTRDSSTEYRLQTDLICRCATAVAPKEPRCSNIVDHRSAQALFRIESCWFSPPDTPS